MKDITNDFSSVLLLEIQNINFELLPEMGIYFWWIDEDGLKRLDIPFSDELVFIEYNNSKLYLCYIGIGPEDTKSKQMLPERIRNHVGGIRTSLDGIKHTGGITNSTLRLSLASLLGLPFLVNEKGTYFIDEILEINEFIRKHFRILVIPNDNPWNEEKALISRYCPPINLDHNNQGWYYRTMKRRREISKYRATKCNRGRKSKTNQHLLL